MLEIQGINIPQLTYKVLVAKIVPLLLELLI
jgi:hypothetical protein